MDNNAPHRAAVDTNRRLGEFSEGSSQTMNNYPITFQVLGPTEAHQSGLLIPLSGARRRALVTRLLLSAGRAVSAETLLEDVWDGQIPSTASATLQSHVSQLRKVLGDRLQRTPRVTCCALTRRWSTPLSSKSGLRVGPRGWRRAMLGGGRIVRDALRLWRGRALQDVADRPWAQPEAERLDELRRVAFEQLLQARLGLGEHEQVVADAEAAVEENPLREQRWADFLQSSLSIAAGGRPTLLRAYERLRNLLCDEIRDLTPSPSVSALQSAVLRQDPALELSLTKVGLGRGVGFRRS